jgi:uncharacterized protein YkwD
MKKIITIMMALIMCISMVACSTNKTIDTEVTDTVIEQVEQNETDAVDETETVENDDVIEDNVSNDVSEEENAENTTHENETNEETSVAGDSNAQKQEETTKKNEDVKTENNNENKTESKQEENKNDSAGEEQKAEAEDETATEETAPANDESENQETTKVEEEVKGETPATEPTVEEETQTTPSVSINGFEQGVFNIINQHRANAGLPALTFEYSFYNAAKTRASEAANYFSHTRPNGSNYTSVFAENGVKWDFIAGENVGRYFADAETAMNAFMNSQVHKDNVLYAGYTRVCIAVVESELYPGYYVVEQLFAGPAGAY